jgi:Zinc finger, C3HC4 type (RING finger)
VSPSQRINQPTPLSKTGMLTIYWCLLYPLFTALFVLSYETLIGLVFHMIMSAVRGAAAAAASASTNMPPPGWKNENCHTHNVLTCSICCDISLDPVVTPCDHIFCRSCIHESLRGHKFCPNDRTPLRVNQLQELTGPIRRIWSQTPVKCLECHVWTGTLQSYCHEHALKTCVNPQRRIQELEAQCEAAQELLATTADQQHQHIQVLQGQINMLQGQLLQATAAARQASAIAPQEQNQPVGATAKRPYSHFSSSAGPFGTTTAPPPLPSSSSSHPSSTGSHNHHLTFGQSGTIWNTTALRQAVPTAAPATAPAMGIHIAVTPAPANALSTNHWTGGSLNETTNTSVNVQFTMGVSPPPIIGRRRIVRARRP